MASIRKEVLIDARPEDVWAALRDFGAVHERLVPGFVVDTRLDGDDRVVTFAGGAVVRERLVDLDDEARRLVWSAVTGPIGLTHHNASAQVFPDADARSRFVWIADVLPHEHAGAVAELMERGIQTVRRTLERRAASTVRRTPDRER
jgi:carbon monoxide dehydrogenase subunit G